MKPCTIYALVDPASNAVHYIGKTTMSADRRLACHLSEALSGHACDRCRWIRSICDANQRPIFRALVVVPEADGSAMERRVIALYRRRTLLINLRDGGNGPSANARQKMSATRLAMGAVARRKRAEQRAAHHATHTRMPDDVLAYFRQHGSRGGTIGSARLTSSERTARAKRAARASALARSNKKATTKNG